MADTLVLAFGRAGASSWLPQSAADSGSTLSSEKLSLGQQVSAEPVLAQFRLVSRRVHWTASVYGEVSTTGPGRHSSGSGSMTVAAIKAAGCGLEYEGVRHPIDHNFTVE